MKLLLPGQPIRLEEYKQMVAERGIAENVDFLGYRRDINNLVGLSDLSVASSFQEGLPINLIEAMAMGNPIVATDVRGNNDAVEDGVNGYLVPVGDSGMMAEKNTRAYERPREASHIRRKRPRYGQGFFDRECQPRDADYLQQSRTHLRIGAAI